MVMVMVFPICRPEASWAQAELGLSANDMERLNIQVQTLFLVPLVFFTALYMHLLFCTVLLLPVLSFFYVYMLVEGASTLVLIKNGFIYLAFTYIYFSSIYIFLVYIFLSYIYFSRFYIHMPNG